MPLAVRRTSTAIAGGRAKLARNSPPKPSCPWCGGSTSRITTSRGDLFEAVYHRRRRCSDCGRRWPTVEALDVQKFLIELRRLGISLADLGIEEE